MQEKNKKSAKKQANSRPAVCLLSGLFCKVAVYFAKWEMLAS